MCDANLNEFVMNCNHISMLETHRIYLQRVQNRHQNEEAYDINAEVLRFENEKTNQNNNKDKKEDYSNNNNNNDAENDKKMTKTSIMHRKNSDRRSGSVSVATLSYLVALLVALASQVDGAPSAARHGAAVAVETNTESREFAKQNNDPFSRFMSKRLETGSGETDGLDVPFIGGGSHVSGMGPMLPDKWSDLFLKHQERSFFPSSYGSGGGGGVNGGYGMEKRRRGLDDAPQFLNDYVNLVEPGRLEWNFNRL